MLNPPSSMENNAVSTGVNHVLLHNRHRQLKWQKNINNIMFNKYNIKQVIQTVEYNRKPIWHIKDQVTAQLLQTVIWYKCNTKFDKNI